MALDKLLDFFLDCIFLSSLYRPLLRTCNNVYLLCFLILNWFIPESNHNWLLLIAHPRNCIIYVHTVLRICIPTIYFKWFLLSVYNMFLYFNFSFSVIFCMGLCWLFFCSQLTWADFPPFFFYDTAVHCGNFVDWALGRSFCFVYGVSYCWNYGVIRKYVFLMFFVSGISHIYSKNTTGLGTLLWGYPCYHWFTFGILISLLNFKSLLFYIWFIYIPVEHIGRFFSFKSKTWSQIFSDAWTIFKNIAEHIFFFYYVYSVIQNRRDL